MKKINKQEIKGVVGGVYMISEIGTDRVYVGSANGRRGNGIQKRWTNHIWKIEQGIHKYFDDITKVRFEILEVVPNNASEKELGELETQYFEYVKRVGFILVNENQGQVKRKSAVKDTTRMKAAQAGEKNPRCRLSDLDVVAIRDAYAYGCVVKELADEYGISYNYCLKIVKGEVR